MAKLKFFKTSKVPNEEILQILNNNIIGTPGISMLYQHLGVENKINKIEDAHYINLTKNERIIGTCCFCGRKTSNAGVVASSFYIRYFSFKEIFRSKRHSKRSLVKNSNIRQEILKILEGTGLDKERDDSFFHYAYVDPRNTRSVLLTKEFGFLTIRKMSTIIFNRINPKANEGITIIRPEEEDKILELIKSFYKGYTMFSSENIFNGRLYYTIRNSKDEILAGMGVNLDNWKIHGLPGMTGKFILSVFSRLPPLNRIFNRDFKFIAVEGIYYAAGQEKAVEMLLEGLLRIYEVNSAMIWADTQSSLYNALKSIDLGLVDKLNKEVTGDVICKFNNIDPLNQKQFFQSPAYISSIDLT